MPRNKQRFGDLMDQAVQILAGGGNPSTSTNIAVKKFWDWKTNPNDASHDLPAGSTRDGKTLASALIYPFALVGSTASVKLVEVPISKRAASWLKEQASTLTATNIKTSLAAEDKAAAIRGYYPAQFHARNGATSTPTEKTSRITGRKYKTRFGPTDQGYTCPFGTNATGTETLATVQSDIQEALPANFAVRFIPEEYTPAPESYAWT